MSTSEEYPVFVDGQKVGVATDFSYHVEHDTQPIIAGPLLASTDEDVRLNERVGTQVTSQQITFSLDCTLDPESEIETVEVAEPKDGYWQVYELTDVVLTGSGMGGVEGMALGVNVGRTGYLGHDVATPDRVTYGSSEQPGVTTTVHADAETTVAGTLDDDAGMGDGRTGDGRTESHNSKDPEWFESDDGFSATKHEFDNE